MIAYKLYGCNNDTDKDELERVRKLLSPYIKVRWEDLESSPVEYLAGILS